MDNFSITNAVKLNRGKLLGWFDLITADGLKILNCSLLQNEKGRWISMPCKEEIKDGRRYFTPVVAFSGKEARARIESPVTAMAERAILGDGDQQPADPMPWDRRGRQ